MCGSRTDPSSYAVALILTLIHGLIHADPSGALLVGWLASPIMKNSERLDPEAHVQTQLNRREMVP